MAIGLLLPPEHSVHTSMNTWLFLSVNESLLETSKNWLEVNFWPYRCHCIKGCGRDHAKFSPVATATYRILPDIKLKKQFSGDDAERIKSSFSEGVIGIDSGLFFIAFSP